MDDGIDGLAHLLFLFWSIYTCSFVSSILGLVAGHLVFNCKEVFTLRPKSSTRSNYNHGGERSSPPALVTKQQHYGAPTRVHPFPTPHESCKEPASQRRHHGEDDDQDAKPAHAAAGSSDDLGPPHHSAHDWDHRHHPPPPRHPQHPEQLDLQDFIKRRKLQQEHHQQQQAQADHDGTISSCTSDRFYAVHIEYPDETGALTASSCEDGMVGHDGGDPDDQISGVSSRTESGSTGTMTDPFLRLAEAGGGATPCCQNDLG